MTTRADVDRLTAAQRRIVGMARADLTRLFAVVDLSSPATVRDALLDVVPQLVREYGNLSAVAAAEWYEEVHPATYTARLGPVAAVAQVQGSVRYHAGKLFSDDPRGALAGLSGSVQRYVAYSGRGTVARNVELDPRRPRYARVPSGSKTCAWCSMLASRGFVYRNEVTAGSAHDFHDDCDCAVVPEWGQGPAYIEGYDPDRMYDQYMQAREASGGTTDKEIAAAMREMFPDEFTDSHVHTN